MFKLMDKKIIAILHIYFWLNWPYVTNYMKSCLFLHAHFIEKMKVVEKLFKKKSFGSFTEKTYISDSHRNSLSMRQF